MFTSLEYKNFRGFRSLKLEGLQRVNLVVGRNNAGKTSFLEGLAILANPQSLVHKLPEMFRPRPARADRDYFSWLIRDKQAEGELNASIDGHPYSIILCRDQRQYSSPALWANLVVAISSGEKRPNFRIRVVSVMSRSQDEIVKTFAGAVRKRDGEEKLDNLFHVIDRRISKVRVIPFENNQNQIMFDFGLSELVPMSQVGQGLHRLLTIFSEILSGDADICIIDEIENGIHHSMLEQVWTGIAAAAELLNIQVFATTHSKECIEAAHAAFSKRQSESHPYDFSIVQLFAVESGIEGRVLDREQIDAAISEEIDVR